MNNPTNDSLRRGSSKLSNVLRRRRNAKIRELRRSIQAQRKAVGAEAVLDTCRESVSRFPDSADLWYTYARVLIDVQRPDEGMEALAQALRCDPAHLMALEYYISLSGLVDSGKRQKDVAAVIHGLARAAGGKRVDNLGALDFLIPNGCAEGIRNIARNGTSLATTAAQIAIALESGADAPSSEDLSVADEETKIAYVSVFLARGRYTSALEVLENMNDAAIPWHALRRAARRALAGPRPDTSVPLLKRMERIKPQDAWVKKQLSEFEYTANLTNYALTKRGFPLPRRAGEPQYLPISNKVLYTLHNALPYNSAGYATRTHGLLSQLNKSGYEVQGVTRLGYPYDMPNKEDMGPIPSEHLVDGVSYAHLSTTPGVERKNPLFDYVQRYAAALQEFAMDARPAVLHAASNHWNGLATVTAANRLGIPSIYEVRGLWEVTRGSRNPEWVGGGMYRMIARMEADAAQGATRVLTITEALKGELIRRGVDEDKISVVPNGVDTARFQPVDKDMSLVRELGLLGKTVIGYIGSILDYEGLELLLLAARSMKSTRDDFHVLIVGDGAELERFKTMSGELDIHDVVTFTGRVPHEDVEKYYSVVDIAPFPRLPLAVCEMVSPLKPFEAMAMGKVVVASNVAALAEIVQDGKTGLLHKKGSFEDLQTALVRLLDDPELRNELATCAMEWVRAERDWNHLASSVTEIYDQLTANGGTDESIG